MYGMGNGADKIIAVLERYGSAVSDYFASDGFVRGHSFRGKKVLTFSEIREKYDDFIILLSFGTSRPEVLEKIYALNEEYEMYAPDVPVAGGDIFDHGFYTAHKNEFDEARALLADERSRSLFDDVIAYKLSGSIDHLRRHLSTKAEIYELAGVKECRRYIDLGAYTGDTIREIFEYGGSPEFIVALEPDPKNFKKLSAFANEYKNVTAINAGAWSVDSLMSFHVEGNRNSSVSEEGRRVQMLALDGVKEAHGADLIKLDVEGCEREALLGCRDIIKESSSPALIVSAYHRSGDLFELTRLIHETDPEYKIYLRRLEGVPAWDLYLVAVKD